MHFNVLLCNNKEEKELCLCEDKQFTSFLTTLRLFRNTLVRCFKYFSQCLILKLLTLKGHQTQMKPWKVHLAIVTCVRDISNQTDTCTYAYVCNAIKKHQWQVLSYSWFNLPNGFIALWRHHFKPKWTNRVVGKSFKVRFRVSVHLCLKKRCFELHNMYHYIIV